MIELSLIFCWNFATCLDNTYVFELIAQECLPMSVVLAFKILNLYCYVVTNNTRHFSVFTVHHYLGALLKVYLTETASY